MLLGFLQYGGAALIILGYWFMLDIPRTSAWCTVLGCALCGLWAFATAAWGVFAIEVFCGAMSLRNVWKAT